MKKNLKITCYCCGKPVGNTFLIGAYSEGGAVQKVFIIHPDHADSFEAFSMILVGRSVKAKP